MVTAEIKIGSMVRVLAGASDWMRQNGFWDDSFGDSIDGTNGIVIEDFTEMGGKWSHWGIDLNLGVSIGVHPQWLEVVEQS